MFSITYIKAQKLQAVALPHRTAAEQIADALRSQGYIVRLWFTAKAGQPMLIR